MLLVLQQSQREGCEASGERLGVARTFLEGTEGSGDQAGPKEEERLGNLKVIITSLTAKGMGTWEVINWGHQSKVSTTVVDGSSLVLPP